MTDDNHAAPGRRHSGFGRTAFGGFFWSLGVGLFVLLVLPWASPVTAADLAQTIRRVKPSVIAVGTYQATRRPPSRLLATGFAVADGRHVVTSAHAVLAELNQREKEFLAVFIGSGDSIKIHKARIAAKDVQHDIAVLAHDGPRLPPMTLGNDSAVFEGQAIAFTGFPIGPVLGFYRATHQGIVSAVVPIAMPQPSARQLDSRMIRQLQQPFVVFQLDATAYPGNSGSPMYDPGSGKVLGVVDSVFIKTTKERVLSDPSGITYVVPIRHAKALLKKLGLSQ